MEEIFLTAEEKDEGRRVDVFVAECLEEISRSRVQSLLESENILVNGKKVKSNYKLKINDMVSVSMPPLYEAEIVPEDIPLDILYEDEHIIVVNKPKGMVVHPAPGHFSGTLVNALMYHCRDNLSGINGVLRPGIVHRIDKDTSGILVAAKTDTAHKGLAEALSVHDIKRIYYAIVMNKVKEEEGTIDKPIGRHKTDRKKMAVVPNGRNAVTHYKVIEYLGKYTFIEARLETGRTHQIRVHMASIGNPLLGDEVYGSKKQPFNTDGQVLHAGVLGFIHPVTGEYMEFSAPLPEYFQKVLRIIRDRM
ncbi:MAG: RluA family pseudouridine synthase [Firmicutes bacterium]|nr:RluA family pseudouridine synthase [Bacillota bacterium]